MEMEGDLDLRYDQIKSELIVEVKEENFEDISGSFNIKTEDQVEVQLPIKTTTNFDDSAKEPPAESKSNGTPNMDKNLILCLKKLTENEIHGYQNYIRRWGYRGTKSYNKKEPNKKISCTICGQFLHPFRMLSHVDNHLGLKSYSCNICDKKYTWKSSLQSHKLTHLANESDASFPCPKCGRTFKLKFRLNIHIKRVHNAVQESKYICQQCEKSFKQQVSLTKHVNSVHFGIVKKTVCQVCKKSYSNIYEHMQSHSDKRYPCDVCNQIFTRPAKVRLHKLAVHLKIRPHKGPKKLKVEQTDINVECKICFKMMKSSILENHQKFHSGENPFLCQICLKSAPSKSAFNSHNFKWHDESEKPYSCSKCPMTFKIQTNFENHVKFNRCHKKRSKKFPKPFKCDICSEEYADFPSFKDHKKSHIGVPIQCQFCPQKFTRKQHLKRHLIRFHSDALKEEIPDEKKECILGL